MLNNKIKYKFGNNCQTLRNIPCSLFIKRTCSPVRQCCCCYGLSLFDYVASIINEQGICVVTDAVDIRNKVLKLKWQQLTNNNKQGFGGALNDSFDVWDITNHIKEYLCNNTITNSKFTINQLKNIYIPIQYMCPDENLKDSCVTNMCSKRECFEKQGCNVTPRYFNVKESIVEFLNN